MKIEHIETKQFKPVTIVLETELEYSIIKKFFESYSGKISDLIDVPENDIRDAFGKATGWSAYDQICQTQL